MTWCMYYLASHQEVQEKLFREIMFTIGSGQIEFEAIEKMKYVIIVLLMQYMLLSAT